QSNRPVSRTKPCTPASALVRRYDGRSERLQVFPNLPRALHEMVNLSTVGERSRRRPAPTEQCRGRVTATKISHATFRAHRRGSQRIAGRKRKGLAIFLSERFGRCGKDPRAGAYRDSAEQRSLG